MRARLGAAGRATAEERFNRTRLAGELISSYRCLAASQFFESTVTTPEIPGFSNETTIQRAVLEGLRVNAHTEMLLPTRSLSVVMPAYNEAPTIALTVNKVRALPFVLEVVIVDDFSTDGTTEICQALALEHEAVSVVRHPRNLGKTAALKTGIALTKGEVVIIQDADLEYDPAEIADVIQPILQGHADVSIRFTLHGAEGGASFSISIIRWPTSF